MVLPRWLVVKNPPANAGNARVTGLSPGSGRSLCIGSGNLLQCSCLKISMNKRAGRDQATEHIHAPLVETLYPTIEHTVFDQDP